MFIKLGDTIINTERIAYIYHYPDPDTSAPFIRIAFTEGLRIDLFGDQMEAFLNALPTYVAL